VVRGITWALNGATLDEARAYIAKL